MARTSSTMSPIGTPAPDFSLMDTGGRLVGLADFSSRQALLVMFICNHCPFVKHLSAALAAFGAEMDARGVGVVAINSNDVVTHPEDSPEMMAQEAAATGYTFPYLFDEDQSVAKAFAAACTPDFFLYDGARNLYYRGQFDPSRPGNDIGVSGVDLRAAVDALLRGGEVPSDQIPSVGCNIKWKAGNEPEYF